MSVKKNPRKALGKKSTKATTKKGSDTKVALRFIPLDLCIEIGTISESTFYRLVSSGAMPKPIKIGRANRWIERDVIAAYKRLARGGS